MARLRALRRIGTQKCGFKRCLCSCCVGREYHRRLRKQIVKSQMCFIELPWSSPIRSWWHFRRKEVDLGMPTIALLSNTLSTSPPLHTAIIVPSSRFLLSTASLRPRFIASSSKRSSSKSNGTDYSRNPGKGSETITSKAHSFHNHPSPVSANLACNSEIVTCRC